MKHRLNHLILSAIAVMLALSTAAPVHAEDTNEAKQVSKPEKKVFFFSGGGPLDFILAMDKHFRTRLGQILSIPSSLARAEVPKMRVATENPEDVLKVYNRLEDPMLGEWKYDGPATNPSVLTLVPDREIAASKVERTGAKVKAMSLAGLPVATWEDLQKDVAVAQDIGLKAAERLGGEKYDGYIHIQPQSKILIASGSEGFIEMVESVVAAHRNNAQMEAKAGAQGK